jgi:hypothetical protein
MVYQWKRNYFSVDAQKAGEEIERIESLKGGITPKDLVEESRSELAVLHECFEWNDAKAAEQFREVQAGDIVRNIVVVRVEEGEQAISPVRAFVSIKHEDESPRYISINKAMAEPEYQAQVLQNALKELESFKHKYNGLLQLKKVIDSISEVLHETELGEVVK